MKNFFATIIVIFVLCFGCLASAHATFVVDTGEPDYLGQWAVFSNQWVAGQFTLNQAYTISDIEGNFRGDGGTLTMVVYGDSANLPDTNNEFLNGQITVSDTHPGANKWYSLSGLSLNLAAGDYWLAYEVRTGDTYNGSVSLFMPDPLDAYVYSTDAGTTYTPGSSFALRIQGDPVPIPGAVWLLGSGLIGLAGLRRKK
ncbi:MAG: VPLPA-CTERM sorting domain-containing protein [Desulfobacteraceae bacterium]|nr:VPLPA-CTERM sorting domain-containing protein [Desulfobacteraceae bacterium]